jgi:hypothetical protein
MRRSSRPAPVAAVVAGAALSLVSSVASAQTGSNAAVAQVLFDEARALTAKGKFTEACPKFAESQRLDPGIGTEFNLAECEQHIGKTASAWAHYLEVADRAHVEKQGARERVARARAASLAPHLAHLTISRAAPGDTRAIEIRRDGIVVGAAQYGVPAPVDPGQHEVAASAPGKKPWSRTLRTPADAATVVAVPSLEDAEVPVVAPAAPALVASSSPSSAAFDTGAASADSASAGRGQRIAGITVGALGIVGLGVGAAFAIVSKGKHDDAESHCTGSLCDATGVSLRSDAIHAGNAATIALAVGGAALVGGGIVFFTAPRAHESEPASALAATPFLAPHLGGLALAGHF